VKKVLEGVCHSKEQGTTTIVFHDLIGRYPLPFRRVKSRSDKDNLRIVFSSFKHFLIMISLAGYRSTF
jgi:hypothetical protein